MRMAFSLASAPPLVKKTLAMLSGACSTISRAASVRGSAAKTGDTEHSLAACSAMAATMRGMLVAEVQVDELGAEVEVAVALVVPERRALAAGDRHGGDLALGGPGVEDVLEVGGGRVGVGGELVGGGHGYRAWVGSGTHPRYGRATRDYAGGASADRGIRAAVTPRSYIRSTDLAHRSEPVHPVPP